MVCHIAIKEEEGVLLNCASKRSRQERFDTGTMLSRLRGFVQGEHKISWGDNWSNRKVSKFAIVCSCRIPKIRLPSFLNFKKTSKMQKCKNAKTPFSQNAVDCGSHLIQLARSFLAEHCKLFVLPSSYSFTGFPCHPFQLPGRMRLPRDL